MSLLLPTSGVGCYNYEMCSNNLETKPSWNYIFLIQFTFIHRAELKTEYKKRFRPFSQYDYIEGRFKPKKEEIEPLPLHHLQDGDSWYREVLELRKKAGEYKVRFP